MAVFELKVEVALASVSAIEDLLAEREEQHFMVLEDKPSARAWLTGYFEAKQQALAAWQDFKGALDLQCLLAEMALVELPDKNWKESYKEHFKAWQFGRLHWVPVWERDSFRLPVGDEVLWLDPGMAFGTGNHETTRLVVERLVAWREKRGAEARVIDAGCGSGILALSAAKLGYQRIEAFDNDSLAVDVSKENAVLNRLAGRVDFYEGDLITGLAGRQADVLLANIQADVLMKFARELLAALNPGGVLILSGILVAELTQVRSLFESMPPGWTTDSRTLGEWSDLVVTRA